MCLAACYYAGISEIVYGDSIEAMHAITQGELCVSPAELFAGRSEQPMITGGVLADECHALLTRWNLGTDGTS